ncbi:MAG: hypothetical protein ABUL64_01080 [Singulisphaera sp.]
MAAFRLSRNVRLVGALALVCGIVLVSVPDAGAIHHRRVVVTYAPAAAAGYVSPACAGPSSFNPVGFGFGGYSYGGYPYYGYYGFLPGPYEGFVAPGAGPFYGQVAYNAYAAAGATGLDATVAAQCAITPAGYVPASYMSPHAYRRYMRHVNRALMHCGYWCAPLPAVCAYGALLGTSAMFGEEGALVEEYGYAGIEAPFGSNANVIVGESVMPPVAEGLPAEAVPAEESPRPALEPTF